MPLPFETAGSVQHLSKREKTLCPKCVNRAALTEPETKLGGIVEVDETFVGGKAKNRHWHKRDGKPGPTASTADRSAVPDGQISELAVQSHLRKYFRFRLTQITFISAAVPSHRGAYRDRHGRGVGCGGRGSVGRADVIAGRVSREQLTAR